MPDPQQFQYIKLPDGSYGKFLASASDGQIQAAISKDFPQVGADDPSGNYDFGDLGSVKGMRTNGRPATRQEALSQLQQQRGFAQTMGQTFQNKRQDVSDFIQSSTDTDKATKGYMGDLAGMLAMAGASKVANIGRGLASDALEQQTSPTIFKQFAQQKQNPAQQLPFLKPSQPSPPAQVAEQPVATERGTWFPDPPKPGFGTAKVPIEQTQQGAELLAQNAANRPPVQSPVAEKPPETTPGDMTGYYGKTAGKSNLKANQRQLASPTGSTAPGQTTTPAAAPHPANIMRILNTPGDISDADMATLQNYFAKQRLTNMLSGAAQPQTLQKAAGQ